MLYDDYIEEYQLELTSVQISSKFSGDDETYIGIMLVTRFAIAFTIVVVHINTIQSMVIISFFHRQF